MNETHEAIEELLAGYVLRSLSGEDAAGASKTSSIGSAIAAPARISRTTPSSRRSSPASALHAGCLSRTAHRRSGCPTPSTTGSTTR